MAVLPWTLILPPLLLGTLGSLYLYPPAFISGDSITTYCYPYVYTLHDQAPNARCFTVRGGKFAGVSNETGSAGVVEWDNGKAKAKGKGKGKPEMEVVVIPGLWDGHGHLLALGEMLESVKLHGAGSVQGT